jgi:hypothetical protein
LSENDADDLEIINASDPICIADLEGFPALRPRRLKKGFDISDRKESVTLDKKAQADNDIFRKVVSKWLQGISSKLGGEDFKLSSGFAIGLIVDPGNSFSTWEVSPIDFVSVCVLGK